MNTFPHSFRAVPAAIRIATFAFVMSVPPAAFAELSNDSIGDFPIRLRFRAAKRRYSFTALNT